MTLCQFNNHQRASQTAGPLLFSVDMVDMVVMVVMAVMAMSSSGN